MEPKHRYFAEALRANFSLARLLGLSNNEIVVIAETELRTARAEAARAHQHATLESNHGISRARDPEPDGA
jgi:hypothetical protein